MSSYSLSNFLFYDLSLYTTSGNFFEQLPGDTLRALAQQEVLRSATSPDFLTQTLPDQIRVFGAALNENEDWKSSLFIQNFSSLFRYLYQVTGQDRGSALYSDMLDRLEAHEAGPSDQEAGPSDQEAGPSGRPILLQRITSYLRNLFPYENNTIQASTVEIIQCNISNREWGAVLQNLRSQLSNHITFGYEDIINRILESPILQIPESVRQGIESTVLGIVNLESRNVTSTNLFIFRLLILAAQNGYEAIVNRILELEGMTIEHVMHANQQGDTALMRAIQNGHEAIVNRILGFEGMTAEHVMHTNNLRDTALTLTARNGHDAIFNRILELEGMTIEHVMHANQQGDTALMLAAHYGREAIANRILELEGMTTEHVMHANRRDHTALIIAALMHHEAIANRIQEFLGQQLNM